MVRWEELSMPEKAEMMKVAIRNGITTLPEIKQAYHEFAEGGNLYGNGSYMSKAKSLIKKHEGWRSTPYKDAPKGKSWRSVGYGFNDSGFYEKYPEGISKHYEKGITEAQAEQELDYYLGKAERTLRGIYGNQWDSFNDNQKAAIFDTYYQRPASVGKGSAFYNAVKSDRDASKYLGVSGYAGRNKDRQNVFRGGATPAAAENIEVTLPQEMTSQPVITATPDFMPMNPQVFGMQMPAYQTPVIAPEQPLVTMAEQTTPTPEQIERQRIMQERAEQRDALNRFGLLMSMSNPQQDNNMMGVVGMLAGNTFAKGGGIHINPSHRGRFIRLKERTGHSASWFKEHGTPAQKKMATFALNARHWKHGLGGNLYDGTSQPTQQMDNSYTYYKPLENIFVDSEGNLRDPEVPRARGTIQLPEVTVSMRDPRKSVPTANVLNPSSLSLSNFLDKDKIYNRIPGDEWYNVVNEDRKSNYGISGPFDALQAYFSNDDNYVLNRLSRYMPYKDISWREKEKAAQDFYEEGRKVKYKFDTLSDAAKHRLEMLQDKSEALPILQHEDAKAVYLGLPQRTNTLRDAEYTPTQGKLNNGKYITYMREPTFVEDVLMPIYNDLKLGRKRIDGKKVAGEVLSLPKYVNSIEEITSKGNAVVHIPFLNNATMSSGHDDRGEYLSIFDTWDYNTGVYAKPGDNIGKHIDGRPFDIYDRIYLDDYYNIPDEYKGSSYLPEATVYGKKKKP